MNKPERKPMIESLRIYGRLSFPHLLKPQTSTDGSMEDSYSTSLLLPPDTDLTPIKQALEAAGVAFWGGPRLAPNSKWPLGPNFRDIDSVIRRCEEKANWAGYEPGWHFISFRRPVSKGKPEVVGGQRGSDGRFLRIVDPAEVYPGRWAVVGSNAFAFSNRQKGLSLGLNNVQLRKHDQALGGKPSAESEFEEYIEEDYDDDDNGY